MGLITNTSASKPKLKGMLRNPWLFKWPLPRLMRRDSKMQSVGNGCLYRGEYSGAFVSCPSSKTPLLDLLP